MTQPWVSWLLMPPEKMVLVSLRHDILQERKPDTSLLSYRMQALSLASLPLSSIPSLSTHAWLLPTNKASSGLLQPPLQPVPTCPSCHSQTGGNTAICHLEEKVASWRWHLLQDCLSSLAELVLQNLTHGPVTLFPSSPGCVLSNLLPSFSFVPDSVF